MADGAAGAAGRSTRRPPEWLTAGGAERAPCGFKQDGKTVTVYVSALGADSATLYWPRKQKRDRLQLRIELQDNVRFVDVPLMGQIKPAIADADLLKKFDATVKQFRSLWSEHGPGKMERLEHAIDSLENALCNYPADGMGDQWANVRFNLGNAYWGRLTGEKCDNVELAIGHYEAALEVCTRKAFPEKWAATHYNLGHAYNTRLAGEKLDNIEMAIGHYKDALKVYTQEAFPEDCAMVRMDLGNAYSDRLSGEKRDNIELAIGHFEAALKVYTLEAFPEDWAMVRMDLGNAYSDRLSGEKRDNLELAIGHFEDALKVYTQEAFPEKWAMARMNLGNAYQTRLMGDKRDNIELAVGHFEAALEVYTQEAFPEMWAKTRMNLGNAYQARLAGDKRDNIEMAIGHYKAALEVYTQEEFPAKWAMARMNLGIAYKTRLAGEKCDNSEMVIGHYKDALKVYTQEAFPEDWAMVRMDLGNAYIDRLSGEKRDNIELAIDHFEAALTVHTQEAFPEDWAMTSMKLGIAYMTRLAGEKRENIELVVGHFEAALEVYTQEAFPEHWAMARMNLGIAYKTRLAGEKCDNIEMAIGHYKDALKVYTQEAFPEKWATTRMNLGNAYQTCMTGEKRANIELAIGHYEAALTALTREAFPEKWAGTRMNQGNAYSDRLAGDKRENIELAVGHFEAALEVYTQEAFPEMWAKTRMNLGNAYQARLAGDKRGNIALAVDHYKAALKVYTQDLFPEDWAKTRMNLGMAYSDHPDRTPSNARDAIFHYSDVLVQTGKLELTVHDAEARRTIRQQTFNSHSCLVQLHMRLDDPGAALVAAEASRARGLADLVSSSDSGDVDGVSSSPERIEYNHALQQLQHASRTYDVAARRTAREGGTLTVERDKLADARARQAKAQAVMEQHDPSFSALRSPPTLNLVDIKSALGKRTVAVVWYMTDKWAGAFVIASTLDKPRVVVYDDLVAIRDAIAHYIAIVVEGAPGSASKAAADLAMALNLPGIQKAVLKKGDTYKCDQHPFLVLMPHGRLHDVPLATLPLNGVPGEATFAELLSNSGVLTVPSFHLLQQARNAVQPLQLTRLVAVENPTGDLPMAAVEVQQVLKLCEMGSGIDQGAHQPLLQSTKRLTGPAAAQADLLTALSESNVSTVLHCACHGRVDAGDSWSSGLQLAAGTVLTVRDVLQQPDTFRHVELCVLSACETALHDGATEWTDECVGLASVLLAVGVPRVLAALWRVDDAATALLVTQLYNELLLQNRGLKDAAAALRNAQYWLRTQTVADVDKMIDKQDWPTALKQRWRTSRVRAPPDVLPTQLWVVGAWEQAQSPVNAVDVAKLLPAFQTCDRRKPSEPSFKLSDWAQFVAAFNDRADSSRVASFELVYSHLFPSKIHDEPSLCCERGCWFRYRMVGDEEVEKVVVLHVHYLTPWGQQPKDDAIGSINVRGAALNGGDYQYEPHPLLKCGIMATGESLKIMSLLPEDKVVSIAKGKGKTTKHPGSVWSMWGSSRQCDKASDGSESLDPNVPSAPLDAVAEWQLATEERLQQTADNKLKEFKEFATLAEAARKFHFDSLIDRLHDIRSVLAHVREKTAAVVPVVLKSYDQVGEMDHEMVLAVAPDYQPFASPRYWAAFVLMGVEGETAEEAKAAVQATTQAASPVVPPTY